MKPRLRIGLSVAFAAAGAAIVIAFAAGLAWNSPWQPAQRLDWDGAAFLSVSGAALEDAGRLRVEGPGADATAVQSLATAPFEARAHPLLRYRFDGLPPALAVSFAFRRADAPDRLHVVELPWPGGGSGSFDLGAIPDWRGTIEEIGFAEFPTPQVMPPDAGFAPFALVDVQLWSPSWRGSLAALGSAWLDPWPWTTRSVHALGRDGAHFRQWPPTLTFALLAALAAAGWVVALRRPPRRLLPALAAALAIGWGLLDLVWAGGLRWRATAARAVYGELDLAQRTAAVPDRDLVEVAQQVAWLLRNEPDVPILIHARSGYPLYRLIWHLLPRNAFALSQAMEAAPAIQAGLPLFADGLDPERPPMLQGEVLKPGSVLVFFNMPQWQFDAARGVVAAGDVALPGEQLLARDRLLVVRYRGLR
ncbi:MAG TPA: hypothetical protein VMR06_13105 [Dokdonella sp.]|uniref:hypothetical protein n=1 Tax=Dokdonella sp. TaxID=2291710 RepID=UPI002B8B9040|nr:hypothetical protein [Dokdonella sp.]HUD42922.1 hypothetical protein [Dokdonella sp.]